MRTSVNLLFYFLVASLWPLADQQRAIRPYMQETAAKSSQAGAGKKTENQLIELEKRLWNGDASDISKLVADDYEVIKHAHRYHKIDEEAAAKDVKFGLVSMDDIQVKILRPDIAIVTYGARLRRAEEMAPALLAVARCRGGIERVNRIL